MQRIGRLLAFVRDFILDFKGDVTWRQMVVIGAIATGIALGVGGAVIFIRGDDDAPATVVATPTAVDGPTAVRTLAGVTPPAPASPTAAPDANTVTVRGEIDVTAMTATGLAVPEHSVELVLFTDTGSITGSMVIAVDAFPIGQLLAGTFDAEDDPEWAEFKNCTTRLVLDGVATGTFDPGTGALQGETLVTPTTEDVNSCLASRPPNVSVDGVVEASTFTWSGTFDGRTVTGMAQLEPPMPFSAAVVE
jgi:hypothetical protein